MPDEKLLSEQSFTRFQRAANKWRNERQKSMLLDEASRLGPRRVAGKLCDDSARLIAQSKCLCEQSKELRGAKKR